jgi:hypothetical protein
MIFVVMFIFVQPLCDCPWYYLAVGALAFVPLYCGPRTYRVFAVVALVAALVIAGWEQISRVRVRNEIERIRNGSPKPQLLNNP